MSVVIFSDFYIDVLFDSCPLEAKSIVRTATKTKQNMSNAQVLKRMISTYIQLSLHTSYLISMSHPSFVNINELINTVPFISACVEFIIQVSEIPKDCKPSSSYLE